MLDHRYDQRPGAVLLLDVHRKAQSDGAGIDAMRLAVDFLERVGHHGKTLRRLHDGVPDEMRERDLLSTSRELAVQRFATRVERGRRDVTEGGCRRDGERLGHVDDEPSGGARYRGRALGVEGAGWLRGSGSGPSPLPYLPAFLAVRRAYFGGLQPP